MGDYLEGKTWESFVKLRLQDLARVSDRLGVKRDFVIGIDGEGVDHDRCLSGMTWCVDLA